ncbi:MAG: chemotaxis response regulator protein-glutamate methylesterase [Nitrospinae bacterium]|nr:chemotaxis response regulator protein-glutamate methylesterase [Nitrospinota bacterium]
MIRVLVVDDSGFMRASLIHILKSDIDIEVIGTAVDGRNAVEKVKLLKPDVVLLDIEMPVMDGLAALSYIMAECPTAVLIISGLGEKDTRIAIKSLEHGAIDFIAKPSGVISYDIEKIREEIISKVKIAAGVDVHRMALELPKEFYVHHRVEAAAKKKIVVIGASTGGPKAVKVVLSGLRREISAAVLVVQHMRKEFISSFAERLKWESPLDISVAQDKGEIVPGKVLIAPGDSNIGIVSEGSGNRVSIISQEASHTVLPSIDFTMESAADIYRDESLGVILTGMGSDGAKGMKAIKDAGGSTIAEDESTSVVFGMPKSAIEMGVVDEVMPLNKIAGAIMRMT